MSTTPKELIFDCLESLQVVEGDPDELDPNMLFTGIRQLNRLMDQLASEGFSLSHTEVTATNCDTDMTIPGGAEASIEALLTVRLAPKYNGELTAAILYNANTARSTLASICASTLEASLPSTLPTGSGNQDLASYKFFEEETDDILSETGGSIALEDDTIEE